MSKESTYIPRNGFAKWFDQRLPLPRMLHDNISAFPTPRNLNYWYTFGGILTFCLVTQILTGIVLAMHYTADAGSGLRIRRAHYEKCKLWLAN